MLPVRFFSSTTLLMVTVCAPALSFLTMMSSLPVCAKTAPSAKSAPAAVQTTSAALAVSGVTGYCDINVCGVNLSSAIFYNLLFCLAGIFTGGFDFL